jgi:hypothetical protein
MTMSPYSTQPRKLELTRKEKREQIAAPGDYYIAELDGKRCVIIVCPKCGKTALAEGHLIVEVEPLIVQPFEMGCPTGCRIRVLEGEAFWQ